VLAVYKMLGSMSLLGPPSPLLLCTATVSPLHTTIKHVLSTAITGITVTYYRPSTLAAHQDNHRTTSENTRRKHPFGPSKFAALPPRRSRETEPRDGAEAAYSLPFAPLLTVSGLRQDVTTNHPRPSVPGCSAIKYKGTLLISL
jgi:hypothetical protein